MLIWSDIQQPNDSCAYTHIIAETEFGRFLLTWKGWKPDPDYGFDETPWNEIHYHHWDDIDEPKKWAEAEFIKRMPWNPRAKTMGVGDGLGLCYAPTEGFKFQSWKEEEARAEAEAQAQAEAEQVDPPYLDAEDYDGALAYVDLVMPDHGRTSCTDIEIANGFYSRGIKWYGRCTRCMMLQVARGDPLPEGFEPDQMQG